MAKKDSSSVHQDLASILQTLSNFTGQATASSRAQGNSDTQQSQLHHGDNGLQAPLPEEPDEDEYDPESYKPGEESQVVQSSQRQIQYHGQRTASRAEKHTENSSELGTLERIDPRSIVTWPAALRYTTRLLHESPAVINRVRTLVKNQHINERQWWSGREEILKRQKSRDQNRAQIQEVLKSLGGLSNEDNTVKEGTNKLGHEGHSSSDEAAELLAYDIKVHNLIEKMNRDQEREIAALRIPFFGLSGRAHTAFAKEELDGLREKMLAFLEEYARE